LDNPARLQVDSPARPFFLTPLLMGNWGSKSWFDSAPAVPSTVQLAPAVGVLSSATFSVARLGWFGLGKDCGVWRDIKTTENELWMWLKTRKSPLSSTLSTIELEDFVREGGSQRGGVHVCAEYSDRPAFDVYHRVVSRITSGGWSFHLGNEVEDEGDRLLQHLTHISKRKSTMLNRGVNTGLEVGQRVSNVGGEIVSKWRLHTTARVTDGDRGARCGGPLVLDITAEGFGVTSWQHVESFAETPDPSRPGAWCVSSSSSTSKHETVWVDNVSFRLLRPTDDCQHQPVGQPWVVLGDLHVNTDGAIHSPFFDASVTGGLFARTSVETKTREGTDPLLALMLSHICSTEFCVASIKSRLDLRTPALPPVDALPTAAGISISFIASPLPPSTSSFSSSPSVPADCPSAPPADTPCVVCLDNPKQVVLVPCGHVCVCTDCASQLRRECPVCRTHFTAQHRVFF